MAEFFKSCLYVVFTASCTLFVDISVSCAGRLYSLSNDIVTECFTLLDNLCTAYGTLVVYESAVSTVSFLDIVVYRVAVIIKRSAVAVA